MRRGKEIFDSIFMGSSVYFTHFMSFVLALSFNELSSTPVRVTLDSKQEPLLCKKYDSLTEKKKKKGVGVAKKKREGKIGALY